MIKRSIKWSRLNVIIAITIGAITIALTIIGLCIQYKSMNTFPISHENNSKIISRDSSKNRNQIINKQNGIIKKEDVANNQNIRTTSQINSKINNDCIQDIDSAFYYIAKEIFTKIIKSEVKPIYGKKYFIYVDEFTDHTNHYIKEGTYYSKKFQSELFRVINSAYQITNIMNQWDIRIQGKIYFSDTCSDIIIEAEMIEDIGNTIIISSKIKIKQIHLTDSTDMPRLI